MSDILLPGDAGIADVLAGKTFSSINGFNITGTRPAKFYAHGVVTSSNSLAPMNSDNGSGTTESVLFNFVTVSGLTFTASFIFIFSKVQLGLWSVYSSDSLAAPHNFLKFPIFVETTSTTKRYVELSGNAYITSTGFQMPCGGDPAKVSVDYDWWAFG